MADTNCWLLYQLLDPSLAELTGSEFDAVFASAFGEDVTAAEYDGGWQSAEDARVTPAWYEHDDRVTGSPPPYRGWRTIQWQ